MTSDLRVGLIGCGHQSYDSLLPGLTAVEGVEMVACSDIDEVATGRTLQQYGFARGYQDYHDMLERESLDAVVVAIPHHLLKDATLASLEAGCHVFVEKPMATSRIGANEIAEAADRVGLTLMVGYCQRFARGRLMMKQIIEEGSIGEIVSIKAAKGGPPLTGWLAHPENGGGELLWLGCHITDQILWTVGDRVERVYGEVIWHPETGADQSSTYTMRFRSGAVADVICSQNMGTGYDFLEVLGTAGRVRADWPSNEVRVHSTVREEYRHPTTIVPEDQLEMFTRMFADEMEAWVTSIRDGIPPPMTASDSVRVLQVIDAVFESGRTGQPVELSR